MKKENELTSAEQIRLDQFNLIRDKLGEQGYKYTELLINPVWANVFAYVLFVPVILISVILFSIFNPEKSFIEGLRGLGLEGILLLVIVMVALIVVHELLHGLTWSIFAERHFKDIEFGFMKKSLAPYCTCKTALPRSAYILGSLMPLIVLGILPIAIAIITGNSPLLFLGIVMIVTAAGDILIVYKNLTYRSRSKDVLYFDHPTSIGGVIFER